MSISTTMRTLAAAAILIVPATAPAALQPGDAASHYTPRALKALGQQWEAKANFYGKKSVSLQRKAAPVVIPVSTSPPEGLEILPGDESAPAVPPECAYAFEVGC